MRESIVGICRFSFLGKCDWVDTRSTDGASDEVLTLRQSMLYTEARLRRRFKAFETMCLPSIRAQTDPDFSFWLLTSPELSEPWMQHLAQLCADIPQIRILVSEARLTSDALRPHLRQAARAAGHPVIQFRIDDDDALSRHHVARIRRNAPTFADQPTFAMSNPEGLIFGSLDGREVQYYRVSRGLSRPVPPHGWSVRASASMRVRISACPSTIPKSPVRTAWASCRPDGSWAIPAGAPRARGRVGSRWNVAPSMSFSARISPFCKAPI